MFSQHENLSIRIEKAEKAFKNEQSKTTGNIEHRTQNEKKHTENYKDELHGPHQKLRMTHMCSRWVSSSYFL